MTFPGCPKIALMCKLAGLLNFAAEQIPMPDNDTRSINGRGVVRLENDRICVFERNGVYQARIRTEANRYLWRSLKTRNQVQAISAARKLYHSIEFRQQSGLPLTNRSVNRVIDEYVTLRERHQTQGRTSIHMLRQIKRVVKFWREYIGDQSIESVGTSWPPHTFSWCAKWQRIIGE